jgi:hypothetical protein
MATSSSGHGTEEKQYTESAILFWRWVHRKHGALFAAACVIGAGVLAFEAVTARDRRLMNVKHDACMQAAEAVMDAYEVYLKASGTATEAEMKVLDTRIADLESQKKLAYRKMHPELK